MLSSPIAIASASNGSNFGINQNSASLSATVTKSLSDDLVAISSSDKLLNKGRMIVCAASTIKDATASTNPIWSSDIINGRLNQSCSTLKSTVFTGMIVETACL